MHRLTLFLKIVATAVIFIFLIWNIDFHDVIDLIITIDIGWVLVSGLVLILQVFIVSLRWNFIILALSSKHVFTEAVKANFSANFINQALPSVIAGDAAKVWFLKKIGLNFAQSMQSVLIDRMIGISALCSLTLLGVITNLGIFSDSVAALSVSALAAMMLSGYLTLHIPALPRVRVFFRAKIFKSLLILSDTLLLLTFTKTLQYTYAILLSFVMHLCTVIVFLFIFKALGQELLPLLPTLAVILAAMLLSMLPVSIAGWGVREGVMVTSMKLLDVDPTVSLAASIVFGVLFLLVSIPGGFLWFTINPRNPKEVTTYTNET